MIPVAEAVARITAAFSPLPAETVPLAAAHGRVLAADVVARLAQPPFAVSAMGRLRGADYRCRGPASHAAPDRQRAGRRALRGHGRPRRDGSHLHRRPGAGRCRHHRDSGKHRGRRRCHRRARGRPGRSLHPPGRARLSRGRGGHPGRASAGCTRHRARRRHEPAVAHGPPQAAHRAAGHRRRDRHARRAAGRQPDREL